jgi:voltage-gated potassium channel
MDVELALASVLVHVADTTAVEDIFSVRRFLIALAGFALVLGVGTVVFHYALGEGWIAALYRSVVTVTLTGLTSPPGGAWSQIFTMILLFSGVAIFLYVAGAIVEVISRGVLTGAWAERKRSRAIENLENHYIICGYGRVGRQVGREFREAGVPFVVLDFNPDAIEAAKNAGVLYIDGNGTEDDDLAAAGLERATGLVASSVSDADNRRGQPLHHAVGPFGAPRSLDRLAGIQRGGGEEAPRRGCRPGRPAVLHCGEGDGEARAQAAGGCIPGRVVGHRRFRHAIRGDHRRPDLGPGRAVDQGHPYSEPDRCPHHRPPQAGWNLRHDPNPEAVLDEGDVMICVGTPAELTSLEELFAPNQAVAH